MLASQVEKAGIPAIFGPNTLALRFSLEYNLQRDHCQRPETTLKIEEVLRKLTGQSWRIRVDRAESSVPVVADPPPANEVDGSPARSRQQRAEAEKEPLIRKALDKLEAQILRVDEGFGAEAARTPELADVADSEES
jgi:hypothetical protein